MISLHSVNNPAYGDQSKLHIILLRRWISVLTNQDILKYTTLKMCSEDQNEHVKVYTRRPTISRWLAMPDIGNRKRQVESLSSQAVWRRL